MLIIYFPRKTNKYPLKISGWVRYISFFEMHGTFFWGGMSIFGELPSQKLKTNMTMKHPPFEDVFPIENRNFPMSC